MDPVLLAHMMQGLVYSHVEGDRLEAIGQADCCGQSVTHILTILIGCMMTEELGGYYKNFVHAAHLLSSK